MAKPGADRTPIDLRSDTVTKPTQAMRDAMRDAEVGDDVFGEDPTLAQLEEAAARQMGQEAGLFLPTGTMANQLAIWTHTGRRGQILLEENCHIAIYEGGAASLLSNVTLRTMATANGVFSPADLERHWTPDDPHFVPTTLVSLENTHNWSGGNCWTAEATREVVDAAHERGVPIHIDGARIHNAATAMNTEAAGLVGAADSVMFCLSKSLCAPVGSVLCGATEFISQARHERKTLGGGMRQAGILGAAGLEALQMVDRIQEDHDNAKRIAAGLDDIESFSVLAEPETNMVMVDVSKTGHGSEAFCDAAAELGVLCLPRDAGPIVRFVTHHDVSREQCLEAVARLQERFG